MFYNTKKGGKMQELEKAGIHGSFKGDSKFFSKNVKVSMMFKSNEWRNLAGLWLNLKPVLEVRGILILKDKP